MWKNSSQTNFKLSSRINFASFAKFKETSDAFKAADQGNDVAKNSGGSKKGGKGGKGSKNAKSAASKQESEGIRFTLATIVTGIKTLLVEDIFSASIFKVLLKSKNLE